MGMNLLTDRNISYLHCTMFTFGIYDFFINKRIENDDQSFYSLNDNVISEPKTVNGHNS